MHLSLCGHSLESLVIIEGDMENEVAVVVIVVVLSNGPLWSLYALEQFCALVRPGCFSRVVCAPLQDDRNDRKRRDQKRTDSYGDHESAASRSSLACSAR